MQRESHLTVEEKNRLAQFLIANSTNGKVHKGKVKEAAAQWGVCRRSVQYTWKKARLQVLQGKPINLVNGQLGVPKVKHVLLDKDRFKGIPWEKRTTIRRLANALEVSKSQLHRWIKVGDVKAHTNQIKPELNSMNKLQRLQYALNALVPTLIEGKFRFQQMQNTIHIDEKWFFMTRACERGYKLAEEVDVHRSCKSKKFITKIMFMCAVARPIWAEDGELLFDGKLGIFPFTFNEAAKRNSKNRPKGTLLTKPIESINKDVTKEQLIEKIDSLLRKKSHKNLIRMAPSYKLLTTVSMVGMVGVPIVLFYLLTKKKPSYLNNSNCTIGTRLETKRRVSGSAAAKRRVSGSAAAEVIGCNDDLLTKILVLLPVKTVVRFKCVSKQWSSLISSEFGFFGSAAAEVIGCNDDLLTKILVLLPVKTVVRFKCVSKQWSSLISSAFFGFFGSAAAEVIGCNDDLLTKILVLLPVKTVGRFKCVSKQWSSLISSEFFTRRHVGRVDSRQPSFIMTDVHGFPELFICHHTKKKLVRVSIPSPIKNPLCKYNILQSWNGLLLISIKFLREDLREDRIDYVVFNPTTKQYRLLQLDGYRPLTICFMCDPSKPEYYKVLMITSITPYIYSVYDLATQEWSHNMQGGDPFKDGAAILEFFKDGADLGFCISTALLLNILVSSIKQGQNHLYTPVTRFPEGSAYDNYIFESVEYANLVQVKTFLGENKLKFRVGVWIRKIWEISDTDTLDFNFENSSVGVRMLGMMREKGAAIPDAVFLFHVPGQLLIYKINQGVKVLVDYRREHFYVKDEWQFEHAHPFIHTFAAV